MAAVTLRVTDGNSAVGQLRRVACITAQCAAQRLAAEGPVVVAAVAPAQNVHRLTATELHISTMQRFVHVVVVPQEVSLHKEVVTQAANN